jgi:tRNA-splicing ligase RtcB
MISLARLQKALGRQGVDVAFERGIYTLTNASASASVLLPESFRLEEKAVHQLMNFASVHVPGHEGHVCKACATPDFHPGSIAPIGSIVATSEDLVIPAIPGTDVNCGMRLITTGLSLSQFEAHREALTRKLQRVLLEDGRDVPVRSAAFAALFDDGPEAFIGSLHDDGIWGRVDKDRLLRELSACIGLSEFGGGLQYAPEALIGSREVIRDPCIGTTGSGNHFVEIQLVDAALDRHLSYQHGLVPGEVVVMIHSGSRDFGFFVGGRWMDRAKAAWPKGVRHPQSGLYGLTGQLALDYLDAMGVAARYAWANRVVLAELVRDCLTEVLAEDKSTLVVDVPHNVVLREHGMNIHRKGATPARLGDLALIPGSMGDHSYVASGLGNPDWLWSCSHGAGRSVRRQAMRAIRPEHHQDDLSWQCVTLREERRIEEAPSAYKKIGPVITAQEEAGLLRSVARLKPLLTFKA